MKNVSKLKRHVMALALGISVVSMASWQGIAGNTTATPPSKDGAANGNTIKADINSSDIKGEVSPKFDISKGFSSIAEKAIMAVVNVSTTPVLEGGRPGKDAFPPFAP